jgi:hypothetical protein
MVRKRLHLVVICVIPLISATPTATSTPTPTATPTPPAGLIAAYNFNEGSGTTVHDTSGNGITGTVHGTTWTTGGRYGNALSFNGSSSYVDLGNPALLQTTGSMTWSAWVKAAANPPNDGQIVTKSNNASGWQLKTSNDTGPQTFGVAVARANNAYAQRYSTTVRSLNVWYHVAGVYNATARTLDIYVNGVLDNGTLTGTIPTQQVIPTVNVNIGRRSGGYYFNGIIDDVRIYNRPLSQAEIQADMNTPVGSPLPTPTPTSTATPTPTATATFTPTPTATATFTPTPTATATFTPTPMATATATATFTPTPTATATATATPTSTPTPTPTPTATPTATAATPTPTATATFTPTPTATATFTPIPTATATFTPTPTATATATATFTPTPTATATATATPTSTPTPTPTPTATAAPTPTPTPTPTPPPGLVAAYGFNEGSGTVVTDVSGNGNNGTISGATWTTSGRYGNALSFNGTNALVTINNSASLQLTSAMTLEAWVYPTTVNSEWRDVIYKGNDNYYLEGTSSNSGHPVAGAILGGVYAEAIGPNSLTANTWAHLAETYDGATLRLYVNGVQVASRAQTGAIATSTNPLQIGGDSLYGQYFAGRIDEVRIYNRALSAAEIQNDINTALSPAPPDTQPPTAPGNLLATAIGVSQVNLSWTASTDNVGVSGYLVERQDPGSGSFVQVGTSTDTSYNDTGLAAGSSYSYRVRATDAAQNLSQYSGVASVTTQAGPAASDNFNRADGGLGVNWAKPPASEQTLVIISNQVTPDIENAHCYAYWTRDTFSQDQYSQVQISNVGPWNGVIVRAQSAIDRFYMAFVFAANDYRIYLRKDGLYYSLSTGSTETWLAGDIIGLEAAGLNPVQLTLLRNGNPVLTYTDATENLLGGSPGIGIYSPSGDHLTIDNWEGGNLVLHAQAPGAPAGDLAANGAPDTQARTVPRNLVATALGVSQVNLSWTASTDNVGAAGYLVERQDPGSTSFVQVGTSTGTSYNDTGLAAGSSYSYRVRAMNAVGNLSGYSGVASAATGSLTIGPRR